MDVVKQLFEKTMIVKTNDANIVKKKLYTIQRQLQRKMLFALWKNIFRKEFIFKAISSVLIDNFET